MKMSDVNRGKLISFGSQKVNDKKAKEIIKTVRISVILPQSTEDKCPEFNYKNELGAAKKKNNGVVKNPNPKETNGLDPFSEDDDDVKRIAAEMEAKYGGDSTRKRKIKMIRKRKRKDDYADIGMGYDESDSFIDNTHGYDEIIPKNVTTLHGGFYINCGALEFKTDEAVSTYESSSSDDETPEKTIARKRVLKSSAESEDEEQSENQDKTEHPEKKQKLLTNTNGMQNAIKKRLFSHDKIKQQIRQKRQDEAAKTVRELLKERRIDLNMSNLSTAPPSDAPEQESPPKEKEQKPPVLASVDDVIESVISSVVRSDVISDESSKDSSSSKDLHTKSVLNLSEGDSNDGKPIEIVHLPENLPNDIISLIEGIKQAAASSTEGKVKFFSGNVNTMLLNLERKCKCLGKQSNMKVYEHLAPFVKCKKETLIKRAKKLVFVEEQKKLKGLMEKLKARVNSIMPSVIKIYEDECRTVVQRKFSSNNDDGSKSLRLPKRQFAWNDDLKKLLKEIVAIRKKCLIIEGKQKETLDKHLAEFVKTDVQVIWPDGWTTLTTLLKYCNIVVESKKNPSSTTEANATPIATPISSTSSITISPSASISISNSCSIPINTNGGLTITPVASIIHKPSVGEPRLKAKSVTISETVISKIDSDAFTTNKSTKPVAIIDIVKSSPLETASVEHPNNNSLNKLSSIKGEIETIIIDEARPKSEPENLSTHGSTVKTETTEKFATNNNIANNYQVIDLTDQPDLKKRLNTKKKYFHEYTDVTSSAHKKEPPEPLRVKSKEELNGSSAFNQIIADSLSNNINRFAQSNASKNSNTVISSTTSISTSDSNLKKYCANMNSRYDYPKAKVSSEGDDIQKVMENLKALEKMSSPNKANEDIKTASPVAVITFNNSYSQDASSPHSTNLLAHRGSSFQDAFQKQFIPDYNFSKTSQMASTSKGNYNSISKHNHINVKSNSGNSERYLQNSNNNYGLPNSSKLKNSCSSKQSGSYDILDDMFANLLNEYGHSRAANSRTGSSYK